MKILRALIPHLAIALNISMLVIVYLDRRNPMMGFLADEQFTVLAVASFVFSVASAVMLYIGMRGKSTREKDGKK